MRTILGLNKNNYFIQKQCNLDTRTAIVLAYNPKIKEWVIWRATLEEDYTITFRAGTYISNENKANLEYFKRISKYAKSFANFYQQRIEYEIKNEL